MSDDLATWLRKRFINEKEWYGVEYEELNDAANRIEAQEALIQEMREAFQKARDMVWPMELNYRTAGRFADFGRSPLQSQIPTRRRDRMSEWTRFNDQFRETEWERQALWRKKRRARTEAGLCWQCAEPVAECKCPNIEHPPKPT